MLHPTSPQTSGTYRRPSLFAPAVVLGLFAAGLPTQLAGRSAGVTNDECLTMADVPPGKQPDRLARLEHCSALYPNDVELIADLGGLYESMDRTKAELAYTRALSLDPDYADVRLRLGRLLLARGAAAEALQQADMALRVQPNRAALLALRHQARLAGRTGP